MIIGVTGSTYFDDRPKVKEQLFDIREKCKKTEKELIVVGGGITNCDNWIKATCFQFEIEYKEAPPNFQQSTFSIFPGYLEKRLSKNKGKGFIRNSMYIKYCDMFLLFGKPNKVKDKLYKNLFDTIYRSGKPVRLI